MYRFKVIHLLIALTFVAFAALLMKPVLMNPGFREFGSLQIESFIAVVGLVSLGVVCGFIWRGGHEGTPSRLSLLPIVFSVATLNLVALLINTASFHWLWEGEIVFPEIMWFVAKLHFHGFFAMFTVAILLSLAWGLATRREQMIRLTAAIGIAFWFVTFAVGYLGTAASSGNN